MLLAPLLAALATTTAQRIGAYALFAVGYPVAIVVICRFVPVVRERRIRWFLAHEAAVAAIVVGFLLLGRRSWINATWGVVAAVWYVVGGLVARSRARRGAPSG